MKEMLERNSNNPIIRLIKKINMANIQLKLKNFDWKLLNYKKILNLSLHLLMIIFCIIGSIIFLQQIIFPTQAIEQHTILQLWSWQNVKLWISTSMNFLKIKIFIPTFIFCYFYYCVQQNIFHKLLKDQYIQSYDEKYKKIHKLEAKSSKKNEDDLISIQIQSSAKKNDTEYQQGYTNNSLDSTVNKSLQMVRSMSRSMIGSIKTIGNSGLTGSLMNKGSQLHRSSKIIQNISKHNIKNGPGKDFSTLFDKGKNLSQSFLSVSSSGIQGQQCRVRIKNRKYYQSIDQKQCKQLTKWYQEANKSYSQSIKSLKVQRSYYQHLMHLKKGLQKQITLFLKQYRQNTQVLKQCLIKFWSLKIEGFQSIKPFKTPYELSNLFRSTDNNNFIIQASKSTKNDILIRQKSIFKQSSSPNQFLKGFNSLKIPLRINNQKDFAEKQLYSILSKRSYLNTILNISSIQGELFSHLQAKKIKNLEKALKILNGNRAQFFFLSQRENQFSQMDLLQEEEIQNIKDMIEIRMSVLIFIVNKINLISSEKSFKVKMNSIVTNDSGYLSTLLNFFNNKNFAQIVCQKGQDQLIPHFNLKVCQGASTGQEMKKQTVFNCKPGVDNSFSVIFILTKKISEYLNETNRFEERTNYSENKREESLKQFIDSLCPTFRI